MDTQPTPDLDAKPSVKNGGAKKDAPRSAYEGLVKAMNNPGEWHIGPHRATHKPSGIQLWIANGWGFFDVCEGAEVLSPIRRFLAWRHFKKLRAAKFCAQLDTEAAK